ncbi:MAG TPA: UpxY family transcription antiterminator [Candidatus Acidoferrales bacterium]|nr:UpxY family transcription antiterminator [Candidatus Acidoferrales bacterium]
MNIAGSSVSEIAGRFRGAVDATCPWFALYTRSRFEKRVAEQLERKRMPVFLPLRLEVHHWQDRYQKVEVPMFRGYLFAQFSPNSPERTAVLRTAGVVRIVGFGQKDSEIPVEQIASLRRVAEEGALLHPHRFLRIGQRVKIASGALAGVEGILVRIRKQDRLVIAVDAIRQAVAVELAGYEVIPV